MILITGADGYIGRNYLKQTTRDVVGIDKSSYDITDLSIYSNIIEGVIHLAAISRVKWFDADPIESMRVNVVGTTAILELARKSKAWVIFASSIDATRRNSLYGVSKDMCESLCYYYSHNYNIDVIIIRLGDVVGEDNHPDKAIPHIIKRVKKGEDIYLNNPKQVFHIVHIQDVVGSIEKAVDDIEKFRGRGTQVEYVKPVKVASLLDITREMIEKYGSKSNIITGVTDE